MIHVVMTPHNQNHRDESSYRVAMRFSFNQSLHASPLGGGQRRTDAQRMPCEEKALLIAYLFFLDPRNPMHPGLPRKLSMRAQLTMSASRKPIP